MFGRAVPAILIGAMLLIGAVGYAVLRAPAEATGPIQAVRIQAADVSDTATVFQIQPDQSEARFIVDEVLRGQPKTVIGETDQVSGQLAVDLSQPGSAQLGTILIGARTLATDDSQRDRALRNLILGTDAYEFIIFVPTQVTGLPTSATVGQPYDLQITGDLSIKGVVRPVTFNATVTPRSTNELEGTAATTIRYADWDINIPQVPFVAGVSEQARLELEFVAIA